MTPQERKHRVAVLTRQGMTAREISEICGITTRTVVRDRHDVGIAQPVARRLTADEVKIAEDMLEDGASYSEIARTLGVHLTCISKRWPGRGWTYAQTNDHIRALRQAGMIANRDRRDLLARNGNR